MYNVMNYDKEKQDPTLIAKGSYVNIGSFKNAKEAIELWYKTRNSIDFLTTYIDYNGKIVFNGLNSDFAEIPIEEAENEIKKNL